MMHNCKKRFCSASAVAALSILLLPRLADAQRAAPPGGGTEKAREPEVAPRGERSLVRQIKYGDWQKFCFKVPGTNKVCRTTISGTWDTGGGAADLVRAGHLEAELLPIAVFD